MQAVYQILSQLTVMLYLIMYMLMFAAGIYLRIREPNQPRPYSVPGGKVGMYIIAGVGFLGAVLAFALNGLLLGTERYFDVRGRIRRAERATKVNH